MKAMQLQLAIDCPPQKRERRDHDDFIAARLAESPTGADRLMESICERNNMLEALKRVESNKGAPGVDGMKTSQLRGYLRRHWGRIRADLLAGRYRPLPVRRKEIPKENGGTRLLGIPTVLDRLVDRVHHDRLMQRIAQRVRDKRVLKLIRAFLNSGILVDGVIVETEEGTPQGGPLSPLLANIVLDELDQKLHKRSIRFVRYADDVAIYVRSRLAAQRVKAATTRFITDALLLVVNEEKSNVSRPWDSKYLGFRVTRFMGRTRIGVHDKSVRRFRDTVREITARKRGRSLAAIVGELNQFLRGWASYFRPGLSKTLARTLDHWICRRLRAYLWAQWKLPRTKVRNLKARGIRHKWAMMVGNTRKGAWRLSKNGTLCAAVPDPYFVRSLGLQPLAAVCS